MSLRFLLDTNVLSEPARREPNELVLYELERHRGDVCTAAPVFNELLFGCYRLPASKRRASLQEYILRVVAPAIEILPYDSFAADQHAAERARLGARGRVPAYVDGQIAAVALVHDLTVVTRNVRDFADFDGLRVVDWSTPLGR